MSFKTFLKRSLLEFFVITTCITAATAILGLTLDPTAKFGYESFFSPFIFGFLSLAPSIVTYSHKELSLKQALMRKLLHFIVLEIVLIGFGFWAKILTSPASAFLFAFAVLIVYITVNLFTWKLDWKDATEINETLRNLQGRSGQ